MIITEDKKPMYLTDLDVPSRLVYNVHTFLRSFQPTESGNAVGAELEESFRHYWPTALTLTLSQVRVIWARGSN